MVIVLDITRYRKYYELAHDLNKMLILDRKLIHLFAFVIRKWLKHWPLSL